MINNRRISYVNRKAFITEFNKMKRQNSLSTAKVAMASGLSPSYVYHIVAKKEQRPVTLESAKKLGRGLKLNASQKRQWHDKVLATSKGNDDLFTPAVVGNKKDKRSLVEVVQDMMAKKSLSVAEVSRRSGLDKDHLKKFLMGDIVSLSKIDEARLARGLGTDFRGLVNAKKVSPKPKAVKKPSSSASAKPVHKPTASSAKSSSKATTASAKSSQASAKQSAQLAADRDKFMKSVQSTAAKQQPMNLRPDVLALAERINRLSVTDVDIVRLFADRLLASRMRH